MLRIGDWRLNPASGEITREEETVRLELRTKRVLLCLAEHPGEVVSIEELLNQAWAGVNVSADSVYQAVATLRRLLGDNPRQPVYIATVPRVGYRLVATVGNADGPAVDPPLPHTVSSPALSQEDPQAAVSTRANSKLIWPRVAWGTILCLVLASAFLLRGRLSANHLAPTVAAPQARESIAVLPFLDLTEGMKEGPFADGMTEELIDKLSKIPGLQVAGATSSFYFKDKQAPISDIARTLRVTYLLDGSVRKSGDRLRVAARLVRADNGYVIWSETYDRPFHDVVMVQDDIAGEVTKALKASAEFQAR
jgi:transcriptional activator of cad operon